MSEKYDLRTMAAFGVAGNYTGHLEQAGEAADFANTVTAEENAPKAIFPTYLPSAGEGWADFLSSSPFDSEKTCCPDRQDSAQIEPE